MGINPFDNGLVGSTFHGQQIVDADYNTRSYVLNDGSRVSMEHLWQLRYQQFGGLGGTESYYNSLRPTPSLPLKDRRQTRWNRRMLRIKEKDTIRRMATVFKVLWALAWLWGSLLAFVLTSYALKWALRVVLG